MDVERIIDEIEQLEEMFEASDIRPLSASDISAANRRHDEKLASGPWFRLWQRYSDHSGRAIWRHVGSDLVYGLEDGKDCQIQADREIVVSLR
jgi:hypothetical protein